MRHCRRFALLLGLAAMAGTASARAQLAVGNGCQATGPEAPGIPLQLDLSTLPGAAGRTTTGSAFVMIPAGPGGSCSAPQPHLPTDVLHGDPGDVLRGDGPPDLLRGNGTGRVEYGPTGAVRPAR